MSCPPVVLGGFHHDGNTEACSALLARDSPTGHGHSSTAPIHLSSHFIQTVIPAFGSACSFLLGKKPTGTPGRKQIILLCFISAIVMFFNQAKIVQRKTKHDTKEHNNKIVHSQTSSLFICHRVRASIRDLKRFKSYFMRLAGSRKEMSKVMEMMPKKLSFSSHWPLHEGRCWSLDDIFIHPSGKIVGPLSVGEGIIGRKVSVPWLRFLFWINPKLSQENA